MQPQRIASFTDISEEGANDTSDSDCDSSFGGDGNTSTVVPNNESYFEGLLCLFQYGERLEL